MLLPGWRRASRCGKDEPCHNVRSARADLVRLTGRRLGAIGCTLGNEGDPRRETVVTPVSVKRRSSESPVGLIGGQSFGLSAWHWITARSWLVVTMNPCPFGVRCVRWSGEIGGWDGGRSAGWSAHASPPGGRVIAVTPAGADLSYCCASSCSSMRSSRNRRSGSVGVKSRASLYSW
jgi:hypothetical protein